MPTKAELVDWDVRHHWHAFTQMAEYEPLVIERAEGPWLYDIDQRKLLDGVSSLWCNLHGHGHPRINAAIVDQLNSLDHVTNLGMSSPPAIALAQRLAELAPGDLQHVFYCCDGSSAVEAALKAAFQYWRQCEKPNRQKTKYLAYGHAYHGDTLGSNAVGGIEQFHEIFKPLLFDVVRIPSPDRRADDDPQRACEYHLGMLERTLDQHADELAALVIEPLVQGAAGMIMQPPGYLRGVRELTRKYDVLMIADEIVTGFGRTGRMFACQHEDVTPDFLCLGKSLSAGYLPMSAMMTTPSIYSAFLGEFAEQKTFFHGHTFGGNPLAAAAAMASLDLLGEEHIVEQRVSELAARLREGLQPLSGHPNVADVRQLGAMVGIEMAADAELGVAFPSEQRVGYRICRESTARGVWLRPLGDTVIVMPPLCCSNNEIELLCRVLLESVDHVCGQAVVTQ